MRHIPRKRFGQHFLIDESVIAGIVAAIRPQRHDRMVEIGPGLGALTRPLSREVDHLDVVEIDRDIVAQLTRAFRPERLTIHQADALRFDFAALGPDLRVVGNLPYNISTPLLFHLGEAAARIRDIHVMLQKEVVERMTAVPGEAAYGRLSVMIQYRFAVEHLLSVPASAFHPAPRVASAVIRMLPLRAAERCNAVLFSKLVKSGFTHRRKTLRNNLGDYLADRDFVALGIDPDARAQTLSVDDFAKIAHYIAERSPT